MLSRQQKWQQRKREQGLCTSCGKKPLYTKNHCVKCAKKANARNRRDYRAYQNRRLAADPIAAAFIVSIAQPRSFVYGKD